jgi:hypothetical protein
VSVEGASGAVELIAQHLLRLRVDFALVGGLAVSVRAEVRFTRDVDLAVNLVTDAECEHLIRELRAVGYEVVALVEHDVRKRIATVRLRSPQAIIVDLIVASSGIEADIIGRATTEELEPGLPIRVAQAEDLLAMKILSMRAERTHDRSDALNLLLMNETLNLELVRTDLTLITERGYNREQDLHAKLDALLAAARASTDSH